MFRNQMIARMDQEKIKAAIAAAEGRTSGEIRVSVAPLFWGSIRRAAERAFERLGMMATHERNGVLFFIIPSRRKLVILGDAAIHEKVGQDFWERLTARVTGHFREGRFTEGLVEGILQAGEELARHFPRQPNDLNELPDSIDE